MFQPSPAVRIFLYCGVADMRKSFDGLSAIVTESIGKNLLSGDYFVFFNRNCDRCKILLWDRDGFVIWVNRCESSPFNVGSLLGERPWGAIVGASVCTCGSERLLSCPPDRWAESHPDCVRQFRREERADRSERARYNKARRIEQRQAKELAPAQ